VQAKTGSGVLLNYVEERPLATVIGKFQDMVKIADRLVGVDH